MGVLLGFFNFKFWNGWELQNSKQGHSSRLDSAVQSTGLYHTLMIQSTILVYQSTGSDRKSWGCGFSPLGHFLATWIKDAVAWIPDAVDWIILFFSHFSTFLIFLFDFTQSQVII